jgi:hypothetical protein
MHAGPVGEAEPDGGENIAPAQAQPTASPSGSIRLDQHQAGPLVEGEHESVEDVATEQHDAGFDGQGLCAARRSRMES